MPAAYSAKMKSAFHAGVFCCPDIFSDKIFIRPFSDFTCLTLFVYVVFTLLEYAVCSYADYCHYSDALFSHATCCYAHCLLFSPFRSPAIRQLSCFSFFAMLSATYIIYWYLCHAAAICRHAIDSPYFACCCCFAPTMLLDMPPARMTPFYLCWWYLIYASLATIVAWCHT